MRKLIKRGFIISLRSLVIRETASLKRMLELQFESLSAWNNLVEDNMPGIVHFFVNFINEEATCKFWYFLRIPQ